MLQTGVDSTLSVMMDALREIQTRGDQMLNVINDQREVLINLTTEVDTAEGRLVKAIKTTDEMVMKRKDGEEKILFAEKNTKRIYMEKRQLKNEIVKLEKDKFEITQNLGSMEWDANKLREEMINNEEEVSRYDTLINLYDKFPFPGYSLA